MVKTMLFLDQVTMSSMWYIPMILCLYTVIPLFCLVLKKVPLRALLLPALVVLATLLVHDANGILAVQETGVSLSFVLRASNVFSFYMLYVLAGYWLKLLWLEAASVGGSLVVIAALSRVPVLKRYALYMK